MRRVIKVSAVALALFAVLLISLFSASIYTYSALSAEAVIAQLRFEPIREQHYLAYLRTGDGCEERVLEILGDQWRVDAEFLKWKYWANLLGLDAQYRLDRFQGRYRGIEDENTKPSLSHDLGGDTALSIVDVAEALGPLNFLTDATYGSSTYHDIDTTHIFYVYRTQTGIITRAVQPSEREFSDGLAIEITRGCGGSPGYWRRFSTWADDRVRALLR